MTEIVPWDELTPGAQAVLRHEVNELLNEGPNQDTVQMIRMRINLDPSTIPYVVVEMRKRLGRA